VTRMIVEVMLKPEIHDPQGEAVASACHRLGFGQVRGIRQGKRFEVELEGPADDAAVTAITKLARDLLSNPVIEDFTVHQALPEPNGNDEAGFGVVNGESLEL
jgi:phosphoribosylformylglycinamidine synthase PurS subunit